MSWLAASKNSMVLISCIVLSLSAQNLLNDQLQGLRFLRSTRLKPDKNEEFLSKAGVKEITMFRFIIIAGLIIVGQILRLMVFGSLAFVFLEPDSAVSAILFIYTPMIEFFSRTGHYVGCANIIQPILYGVPAGVFIYAILGAAVVCLATKRK